MTIEEIIRFWKADEETVEPRVPANPVGRELNEQELSGVVGANIVATCNPCNSCCLTCTRTMITD